MTLPVPPPIKPMLAKVTERVPEGDGWVYEPKWDGFRTIVYRDGDEVTLRSRNDRPMNRYFPEVVEMLCNGLPEVCVVDGEIVLPTPKGLDFDALQQRLHPAASRVERLAGETPASFVAFDLLGIAAEDVMAKPLSERQDMLDKALDAARPKSPGDPATRPGPCLFLTPRTYDASEANAWFDELELVGADGIIAKRLELPYSPGDRVMLKIKHKRTADCVVIGYRSHKHGGVGSLLLGLYGDGRLHYVGHTSSFNAADRRALLEQLEPMRTDPPEGLDGEWGPGGQSRWSQGKDQEWFSIEPVLVCEVSYDYMQSGQRFRHATGFIRWRDDKRPDECTMDQVER
jgi:ATP-dependent DNA ligase